MEGQTDCVKLYFKSKDWKKQFKSLAQYIDGSSSSLTRGAIQCI